MFTYSSVSEFGPELMKSGRGDLLVQAVPPRGLVGALESRFTTQAKKVEEPTWRRWSRSPCCLTLLNLTDFLALVISRFPPVL